MNAIQWLKYIWTTNACNNQNDLVNFMFSTLLKLQYKYLNAIIS